MSTSAGSSSSRSSVQEVEVEVWKKHDEYYQPDGNIVLKVENTLFKIDLSVLHDHSPVLRNIVPPICEGKTCVLGFNDQHPFVLREVSVVDFERLLWILLPAKDAKAYKATTIDEWLSILKLSTKYDISPVKRLATLRLHAMRIEPVRKIAIWEEYHLDASLLLSSYVLLCMREEPLTLAMTMSLGIRNFTKVAAAREMVFDVVGGSGRKKALFRKRHAVAVEVVAQLFGSQNTLGSPSTLEGKCEAEGDMGTADG